MDQFQDAIFSMELVEKLVEKWTAELVTLFICSICACNKRKGETVIALLKVKHEFTLYYW